MTVSIFEPSLPIYSLKRAKKLQGGRNDYSWHFGASMEAHVHLKITLHQLLTMDEGPSFSGRAFCFHWNYCNAELRGPFAPPGLVRESTNYQCR
jgi:hypothetical protein